MVTREFRGPFKIIDGRLDPPMFPAPARLERGSRFMAYPNGRKHPIVICVDHVDNEGFLASTSDGKEVRRQHGDWDRKMPHWDRLPSAHDPS